MPAIEISPDGHLRTVDMLGLKVEWRGVAWASAKPRAIEEPHRGAEQPQSNNHFQDALIKAVTCPYQWTICHDWTQARRCASPDR